MTAFKRRQKEDSARATPQEAIRAEAEEPACEDAMECLRCAVEEQLRLNAGKIAKALAEKAACGDLNAAKLFLVVIKEKPRPRRSRRRDGPSEAQRLAAEPPWQEPPAELSAGPFSEPFTEIERDGIDLDG
jgi:hypothetical protein